MSQTDTNVLPSGGDLRAILNRLDDAQLDYVLARAKTNSDAEAYRAAGISKATFYRWPRDVRDRLNEYAQQVKRRVALRVVGVLEDAAEDAAKALVSALKHGNINTRLKAAVEVLDRTVGKSPERYEVTGEGGGPIGPLVVIKRDSDD